MSTIVYVDWGDLRNQNAEVPDKDIFLIGDQNWFPLEIGSDLLKAADVDVVFGRPNEHGIARKEGDEKTPVTVVFEVLSPNSPIFEMFDRLQFYDEYGVEEYYVYDPDSNRLLVYLRGPAALRLTHFKGQFTSPRLGIRFDLTGPEMVVSHPDARPLLTYQELEVERAREASLRQDAEQRADNAEQRAARLAELSRKMMLQQATPQEIQELQQLVQPPPKT